MVDHMPLEFVYRPRRGVVLVLFLFLLCLGSLPMGIWMARHPESFVAGDTAYTANQMKWLGVALAALSPVVSVLLGIFLYVALTSNARVVFNSGDTVTLPRTHRLGVPAGAVTLRLEEIVSVEVKPFVGSALMMQINHASGRVSLFSNYFLRSADFHSVARTIEARKRLTNGFFDGVGP